MKDVFFIYPSLVTLILVKFIIIHSFICVGLNTCIFKLFRYFDIDKKSGATFLLLDSLQTGVISLMGIGKDINEAT